MDEQTPDIEPTGMDRRSVIKRGAIVGGALIWTTPVVQSIARPAFAAGSDGGGGGDEVCVEGGRFAFKHDETSRSFENSLGGPCTITSTAPVTQDSALVSVAYSARPNGDAATRATITLAPGYELRRVQGKASNQGAPNGTACPAVITDPSPVSGTCETGFVYTIDSTATNNGGRFQNLSHISGEIECVGCS